MADMEKALEFAKSDLSTTFEKAKSDACQLAITDFKRFEQFIVLLRERYDGGWVAAKRCVCHTHPSFDRKKMEASFADGTRMRPLEGEPFICAEEVIANVLPTIANEEVPLP